jgi:hypothetical protein
MGRERDRAMSNLKFLDKDIGGKDELVSEYTDNSFIFDVLLIAEGSLVFTLCKFLTTLCHIGFKRTTSCEK